MSEVVTLTRARAASLCWTYPHTRQLVELRLWVWRNLGRICFFFLVGFLGCPLRRVVCVCVGRLPLIRLQAELPLEARAMINVFAEVRTARLGTVWRGVPCGPL